MNIKIRPADWILCGSIIFYLIIVLFVSLRGQVCDASESLTLCMRGWAGAVGTILGGLGTAIVSFMLYRIERSRLLSDHFKATLSYYVAISKEIGRLRSVQTRIFGFEAEEIPWIQQEILKEIVGSLKVVRDKIESATYGTGIDIQNQNVRMLHKAICELDFIKEFDFAFSDFTSENLKVLLKISDLIDSINEDIGRNYEYYGLLGPYSFISTPQL